MKELGYHVQYRVLNALDCGLPQKRERVIIVGRKEPIMFTYPEPIKPFKPLSEILEKQVDAHNYLLVNGQRRLTPREMLRLQGFPDWYKIVVSDSQKEVLIIKIQKPEALDKNTILDAIGFNHTWIKIENW